MMIIAGRFLQQAEVDHAVAALAHAGFSADQISTFYVGPTGQPASRQTSTHNGNLPGGQRKTRTTGKEPSEITVPGRPAGLMVAVSAPDSGAQEIVAALLSEAGARSIAMSEGEIVRGDWEGFNPDVPHASSTCHKRVSTNQISTGSTSSDQRMRDFCARSA